MGDEASVMYRLRFLWIMLKCFLTKPKGLMEPYDLHFYAMPFIDTDVTRLFTHAYASMTALGRWHYVFASDFRSIALKRKWLPVTIAETLRFKRSVRWGEKVTMRTEVVGWNEKAFFLRQTFFVRDEERAVCYTEGIVRSPQGPLRPGQVFATSGIELASPPLPEEVARWHSMYQ